MLFLLSLFVTGPACGFVHSLVTTPAASGEGNPAATESG
jgi:hypothetical protein